MTDILRYPAAVVWDKKVLTESELSGKLSVENGKIYVTAPEGVSYVVLRWSGEIPLCGKVFGDAFERSYGNLEWRGIIPERVMPWYCAVYDGNTCEGFGVRVRPNALCFWQVDELGVSLTLDLRSGTAPARISEKLCAAELVHLVSAERPFGFMRSFCLAMSDSPVFPEHPVYGSNSWYYCYSPSTPDLAEKDAEFLEELTAGLENRPYTVVDCGWSESNNPEDPCPGTVMAEGSAVFGNMKEVAGRIRKHNVHPGLWLRPLCISNGKAVPEGLILHSVAPYSYPCLDPSVKEALEIVAADVKRATAEWGYDLIKIDFSTYDIFRRFHEDGMINNMNGEVRFADDTKTTAQIVKDFYATVAGNASGAVIIGCDCIGHLSSGYFHIYRTGDDTSGQVFERTRRMGVNTLAHRLCQHGTFYDVDADCMGQTDSISWERNIGWLDILAYSGTPLFVSIHPDKATAEQKKLLSEAFRHASEQRDVLEPLDLTDMRCPVRYLVNGTEKRYCWLEKTGVTEFII